MTLAAAAVVAAAPDHADAQVQRAAGFGPAFDLRTAAVIFGGYGTAKGNLGWESARRAVPFAAVTDWCDDSQGDSRGAYLVAKTRFRDGTSAWEPLFGDGDGCNVKYAETPQGHGVYNPGNKVIASVVLRVCYNAGYPDTWDDCTKMATSQSFASPF